MSWKTLEAYKKISDKIEVKVISGNINNPVQGDPWEIKVTGVIGDMSSSTTLKSLEKTVNDLSKKVDNLTDVVNTLAHTVKEGFESVNSRLDNIESLPTIQKELKELKK